MNAMKTVLQKACLRSAGAGTLVLLVVGCASQAAPADASAALSKSRTALACTLPSNCVNSLDGGLAPLRFQGTPTQALDALRAALAEFPEAKIVQANGLSMEVVFTTPMGFKDLVDFRVDAQAQRIDYRSRSSIGLFDFGKNRSRMSEFSRRFEQKAKR